MWHHNNITIIIVIIIITLFKLLKMYQCVKNKLVLIDKEINIIYLNYIKMIIRVKYNHIPYNQNQLFKYYLKR